MPRVDLKQIIESYAAKNPGAVRNADGTPLVPKRKHVGPFPPAPQHVKDWLDGVEPEPNIVTGFKLLVRLDVPSLNAALQSWRKWIACKEVVKVAVEQAWITAGKPIILTPYSHRVVFSGEGKKDSMNLALPLWKHGVDKLVDLGALPGDSTIWDKGGAYAPHDYRADIDCASWSFEAWTPPGAA